MKFTRITHDPAVMGGKPCIRGLRVTVGTVIGLLASGESRERILQAYRPKRTWSRPTLTRPWPTQRGKAVSGLP